MSSSSEPDRVIELRSVNEDDLAVFFEQQLDPTANHMAAFTARDPADRDAFMVRWGKILADAGITARTILFEGQVAGNVLCHAWFGKPEISYWIGRPCWGKGVASTALLMFLNELKTRPLHARVARDNLASIRVLEKCGFTVVGRARGFSNARGEEVEELLLELA